MLKFFKNLFSSYSANNKTDEISLMDIDLYEEINIETDKCPSCGYNFEEPPKSKRKCPSCGNTIVKRKHDKTKVDILLTDENSKKVAKRRRKRSFIKGHIDRLGYLGMSERMYLKHKLEYIKGREFYKENDIVWSAYNYLASKKNSHNAQEQIYRNMALFLKDEGKKFYHVLRQSHKHYLLDLKEQGLNYKVSPFASNDSCEACKKLSGTTYALSEALEIMPLPCKECSNEKHSNFCRCVYSAEPVR